MVWPFKKKRVLDFTKGEIPMPKNFHQISQTSIPQNDTVDLTSNDAGGLGFLGAMANSSETSETVNMNLGEKHIKVKVEDMEYKLDSLSRQIGKILDRLDLAEKKIDRNNRVGS